MATGNEDNDQEFDETSILDSALLESLFYNEFVEDPNFRTSLMTSLSESAGENGTRQGTTTSAAADPSTFAEKALLHDFGVAGTAKVDHAVSDTGSQPSSSVTTSGTSKAGNIDPNDQKKGMIGELAASRLGSRLGVSPEVLQSLEAELTENASTKVPAAPVFSGNGISLMSSAGTNETNVKGDMAPVAPVSNPPQILEDVRSAADDAIAAATKKRSTPSADESSKPAYSKRRKKPRLEDCESKLTQLKSENEMLKLHLANISKKSQAHDKQRIESEQKMEAMLENGASSEELDAMVEFYKEMFSDYGRRRHQEIVFHLDQLSRLATPANFTKMGLWTLGQQSKGPNPITGILQKELDIQPQQKRKILDQREKIRAVCSNLKESLALLGKLKTLCEQKTTIFNDRMRKCREILTPGQVVRLLVWINNHSNVVQTVFPGWGSQMLQSASHAKPQDPTTG